MPTYNVTVQGKLRERRVLYLPTAIGIEMFKFSTILELKKDIIKTLKDRLLYRIEDMITLRCKMTSMSTEKKVNDCTSGRALSTTRRIHERPSVLLTNITSEAVNMYSMAH
ncbi:hypothetical protein AcV5_002794 [Taiwanofungus camphoratus]|nr:hypothetical protein AcV5_002794 [Antrodia cinnamomea]